MSHKCKIAFFLLSIGLFSVYESSAVWWWLSKPRKAHEALPDISNSIYTEFDRICQTSSQSQPFLAKIQLLKNEHIPSILQEVEYQHEAQPFQNNAELLTYAFALTRSACLDFYGELVDACCKQKLQKNPPCSPECMNFDTMRTSCVRYLYDKAFTVLSSKKGNLGYQLKNIEADIDYAIHLQLKYGSPLF